MNMELAKRCLCAVRVLATMLKKENLRLGHAVAVELIADLEKALGNDLFCSSHET